MTTFKKHKVVLLPTDNRGISKFVKDSAGKLYFNEIGYKISYHIKTVHALQHLYIVSNEDITEGDYAIDDNGVFGPFEKGDLPVGSFKGKIVSSSDRSLGLPLIPVRFITEWIEAGCPEEIEVEYEATSMTRNHNTNEFEDDDFILTLNSDNTINCRLIEDSWDRIRSNYYSHVAKTNSSQPFVEWLKENYEAPKKK